MSVTRRITVGQKVTRVTVGPQTVRVTTTQSTQTRVRMTAGTIGPQGPIGATGPAGPAGPGVPAGGTVGQILTKQSVTDYDSDWQNPAGGGDVTGPALAVDSNLAGFNGTTGKLIKDSGVAAADAASAIAASHSHTNKAQLDLVSDGDHDVRTDNPHVVTAAQVGASPTGHAHVATDVTDFDTEVSNNTDVAANTAARHSHANKAQLDLVSDGDHDVRTDNPHGVTAAQLGLDLQTFGFPNLTDSVMSFVDSTRTFTIAPAVTSFDVWVDGTKYTKNSAQTTVIPDTRGFHFIYFDNTGTLQNTTTKDQALFFGNTIVASVYWEHIGNYSLSMNDRRHGVGITREELYYIDGVHGPRAITRILPASVSDGDGSLDTDAQIGMNAGSILLADIQVDRVFAGEPVQIPIMYRDNAVGDGWAIDAATNYPVKSFSGGSGRLAVNSYLGGWGQFEVPEGSFLCCHLMMTMDPNRPLVAFQGINSYNTIEALKQNVGVELDWIFKDEFGGGDGIPIEGVFVATLYYQTAATMTNAVKGTTVHVSSTDQFFEWVVLEGQNILSHTQLRDIGKYNHAEIDAFFDAPALNVLNEATLDAGILIEGVLLKDGAIPGLVPRYGFPNITDSTMSFVDGTRTFTIQPTGASFDVWVAGVAYTKSGADTVVISDLFGLWFIYYDNTGTLQAQRGFTNDLITENTLVAAVYWNAFSNVSVSLCDERHSLSMSNATHLYLNVVAGMDVESGLGLYGIAADGDGSSDTHAQLATSSGEAWYQDIGVSVTGSVAPAQIPVFWRSDANGEWVKETATNFPLTVNGSGVLEWNNPDIFGDWGQETVPNGRFILMHIFVTNATTETYIAIQGQATYTSKALAREGAKVEMVSILGAELPMTGMLPVGSIMLEANTAYTNSVNCRIVSVVGEDYMNWLGATFDDHKMLLNVGDNTHADIDTHIANTSNPHSVTAAQLSMDEAIEVLIDGGGATITTGIVGDVVVKDAMTITGWTLLADQSGSIAIDVWKDSYANFPPTDADSTVTPSISSATKNQATGLSISVAQGDVLRFNVDSVTSIQRVTLALTGVRA